MEELFFTADEYHDRDQARFLRLLRKGLRVGLDVGAVAVDKLFELHSSP